MESIEQAERERPLRKKQVPGCGGSGRATASNEF